MSYVGNWIRDNPIWAIVIIFLLVVAPVAVLDVLFHLVTAVVELAFHMVAPIFDESLR